MELGGENREGKKVGEEGVRRVSQSERWEGKLKIGTGGRKEKSEPKFLEILRWVIK